MSAGSKGSKGSGSGSGSNSSISRCTGEGADEGMVGISDGVLILAASLSTTLGLYSTVWKSVDTSDLHTSAEMKSVDAGVSHGGTVSNSVSAGSDSHFAAVSYSVSQMIAVS